MKFVVCVKIDLDPYPWDNADNLLRLRLYLHRFDDEIDVTVSNIDRYEVILSEIQLGVFDFKYVLKLLTENDTIIVYINEKIN